MIPKFCIFCQNEMIVSRERLGLEYRKVACLCKDPRDHFPDTYRFCIFIDRYKDIFKRSIIVISKYKVITTYHDFEGLRSGTEFFVESAFSNDKAILYLADPIPVETQDQVLSLKKSIPVLLTFS